MRMDLTVPYTFYPLALPQNRCGQEPQGAKQARLDPPEPAPSQSSHDPEGGSTQHRKPEEGPRDPVASMVITFFVHDQ
jgi:hypothetical protein